MANHVVFIRQKHRDKCFKQNVATPKKPPSQSGPMLWCYRQSSRFGVDRWLGTPQARGTTA